MCSSDLSPKGKVKEVSYGYFSISKSAEEQQSIPATPVEIEVELDAKPQSVQLCRIDEEHGNPLKCWQAMGEPEDMTPVQVQQVIEESAVDYAPAPYEYADGKLTVKTELVTNDLAFIRIVK